MRTKYEQDSFAVYKGKIYSAYTKNGFIRLRTYESGGFKLFSMLTLAFLQLGIIEI